MLRKMLNIHPDAIHYNFIKVSKEATNSSLIQPVAAIVQQVSARDLCANDDRLHYLLAISIFF